MSMGHNSVFCNLRFWDVHAFFLTICLKNIFLFNNVIKFIAMHRSSMYPLVAIESNFTFSPDLQGFVSLSYAWPGPRVNFRRSHWPTKEDEEGMMVFFQTKVHAKEHIFFLENYPMVIALGMKFWKDTGIQQKHQIFRARDRILMCCPCKVGGT